MQEHDLVLNLHGEMMSTTSRSTVPPSGGESITALNAEAKFLPQLFELHANFPDLRIVLEHVTTTEGLDGVRRCGPNVCQRLFLLT